MFRAITVTLCYQYSTVVKFRCFRITVYILFLALHPYNFIILQSFSERRRYFVARRPSVTLCVPAALVSAAKVMRCIQCCLVIFVRFIAVVTAF